MRLTCLGVRGSTPSPGTDYVRYGGNTSCVALTLDGTDRPTIVLDAGTGLRSLPPMLGAAPYSGSILLSHLHWDHVQGIPFCPAVDREGARVNVLLPAQNGRSGRDLLAQLLSPPVFPIVPEQLGGSWSFDAIEPGRREVEGAQVNVAEIAHKGGRTFVYRVDADGGSVAYAPDHAPASGVSDDVLTLLDGVDVLIHDAQFVDAERQWADAFGHATITDAVALAEKVQARTLLLFHHGPNRKDDALDRITDGVATPLELVVAYEGLTLDVSAGPEARVMGAPDGGPLPVDAGHPHRS